MDPVRSPARSQDDETFWEEFASDVEGLRSDPEAWAAYQAEIALWDRAAADGLDRERRLRTPRSSRRWCDAPAHEVMR